MSDNRNKKHSKHKKSDHHVDFEEESRRRKDFKRRKRDIREQEYDQENEEQYSEYNY